MNFSSPSSKSDCVKLFRAAVDAPWKFGGQKPVVGWTRLNTLHARKRIGYRNAFQTILTARLRPSGGGTHVTVSAGMSGVAIVFLCVWFGILGLIAVVTAFSAAPSTMMFPFGFMAFGIALVAVGRYFAREEAQFLTEFLIETFDLERVE